MIKFFPIENAHLKRYAHKNFLIEIPIVFISGLFILTEKSFVSMLKNFCPSIT